MILHLYYKIYYVESMNSILYNKIINLEKEGIKI